MQLPTVWTEPFSDYIENDLKNQAAKLFRIHQLPNTVSSWHKLRAEIIEKLWDNLGTEYDSSLELDLWETGETKMDGYTIKNVYYQSRPGLYVTGNLYIPDGEGPFPGVIGMHGHWQPGRLVERVQSRGHTLAKNGYVCLLVDAWGSGERTTEHGNFEYHGSDLGGALFNIGESLMGAQIVDNMRGVDVLCSLDYVDSTRLGATGASGGGNQTMWLSALDERIVAAVPVVSVGTFQSYIMRTNCICECLPNGLTFTEESGVLALIAPRALKICNCLGDTNPTFFPSEMMRSYTEARKVFKAYKEDSKLSYQVFNLPHGYWPEVREAMLGWFDLHLKGQGTGAPKAEKPFSCLPQEELMVFKKGKRPDEVISIGAYCRNKGTALKNEYTQQAIDPEIKRNELKDVLKITSELKLKHVHDYGQKEGWKTLAVESVCGRMIPVLLREPRDGSKDYVIASSLMGKNELTESKYFKNILNDGKGVIAFDAYAGGETSAADTDFGAYHLLSRTILWLGRTLYGEWGRDYNLLADWAKDKLNAENIELFGYKESGTAAILTAAALNLDYNITAEKSPESFVFLDNKTTAELSLAYCLPKILKWGDLDLAVKLNQGTVSFKN